MQDVKYYFIVIETYRKNGPKNELKKTTTFTNALEEHSLKREIVLSWIIILSKISIKPK